MSRAESRVCAKIKQVKNSMEDVLALILSRLDNSTISNLKGSNLWESVVKVAGKNEFWHLRSESLLDMRLPFLSGAWKEVYYVLERYVTSEVNPFTKLETYSALTIKVLLLLGYDPTSNGVASLEHQISYGTPESVQVLLEDERMQAYPITQEQLELAVWGEYQSPYSQKTSDKPAYNSLTRTEESEQRSAAVLGVLLNYSNSTEEDLLKLLTASVNNYSVVELLLERGVDPTRLSGEAIRFIIQNASARVLDLLIWNGMDPTADGVINPLVIVPRDKEALDLLLADSRVNSLRKIEEGIVSAISNNRVEVAERLLEYNIGATLTSELLILALRSGSIHMLKLVLSRKTIVPQQRDLISAISLNRPDFLELLLKYTPPTSNIAANIKLLSTAALHRDSSMLLTLLEDGRVDISTIENNLFDMITDGLSLENMKLLLEYGIGSNAVNKVDLELLKKYGKDDILELLERGSELGYSGEDRLIGCIVAYAHVTGDDSCVEAVTIQDDNLKELLHILIVERASLLDILRWLVSRRERAMGLAAYDWRYGTTSYVVDPIQTAYYAIISLVEQRRSMLDILEEMGDAGASKLGIGLSARLLGAYFGYRSLNLPGIDRGCMMKHRQEILNLIAV